MGWDRITWKEKEAIFPLNITIPDPFALGYNSLCFGMFLGKLDSFSKL